LARKFISLLKVWEKASLEKEKPTGQMVTGEETQITSGFYLLFCVCKYIGEMMLSN